MATTWREQVKAKLMASNVPNVAGVLVIATNGDHCVILSSKNPNLERTDSIDVIELKLSARASGVSYPSTESIPKVVRCEFCWRRNSPSAFTCAGCGAPT
jgi:hypothetical protein